MKFFLLISFFTISGCVSKHDEETKIINHTFLSLVDTAAYKYHTLRPGSGSEEIQTAIDIPITVNTSLQNITELGGDILQLLHVKSAEYKTDYVSLYEKSRIDTPSRSVGKKWIKNSGKFTISYVDDNTFTKSEDYIGHIAFSRVFYDDNSALVQTYIRDNLKSAIVYLNLLKKINNKWEVVEKIPISVT